jgi:hypothetical protein
MLSFLACLFCLCTGMYTESWHDRDSQQRIDYLMSTDENDHVETIGTEHTNNLHNMMAFLHPNATHLVPTSILHSRSKCMCACACVYHMHIYV